MSNIITFMNTFDCEFESRRMSILHGKLVCFHLPIWNRSWAQLKLQRWCAVTFWKPVLQGLRWGDACFSWYVAPFSEKYGPQLGIWCLITYKWVYSGEIDFLYAFLWCDLRYDNQSLSTKLSSQENRHLPHNDSSSHNELLCGTRYLQFTDIHMIYPFGKYKNKRVTQNTVCRLQYTCMNVNIRPVYCFSTVMKLRIGKLNMVW